MSGRTVIMIVMGGLVVWAYAIYGVVSMVEKRWLDNEACPVVEW